MDIFVDTSVWSLALRRSKKSENNNGIIELRELISDARVMIIGPIRQEVLSGIKDINQFNLLKEKFGAFTDLEIKTEDYEKAAEFYNLCRSNGIQGSHIDFLICAVGHNYKLPIFTKDQDFIIYQEYCPIELHEVSHK